MPTFHLCEILFQRSNCGNGMIVLDRVRDTGRQREIIRGPTMRVVLIIFTLALPVSAFAQQYLEPYQPNAFGPGINRDATGRPFVWQTEPGYGPADPLAPVRPDVYGPGIGMDVYGRPVNPAPFPPSEEDQDDDD
jgi:hypothetical protein